ncbi:MAG TPA: HAMP domain-containing protein, partial [Polyangiaceae bacterium]|nr:HAMP domain-containing protein [Polyangiaceae bacterium]
MGTKSAIWLCLVLAATGVVTALRLSNLTRERLVDGKVTAATMVADLFAASVTPALDFEDRESLAQEAAKLGTNPEIVYAAVFLPGSPAPVTEWLPDRAGRHASAPTRPNTEIFSDHIDVSRVLSAQDGHPLGGLVLRVSLAHENERLAEARKRIFEYTGGVTFLVVLGLLVITRRIVTKPLRDLALATRGLEQGRAEPVAVRANDEVGQLGGAFNAMAAAIVDREARLAEVNRELMQLLDGMRQAILVFEPGGVLGAAKSHEAEVIFDERDVEGLKVQELLYGTAVADVGAAAFEEWIAVAFTVPPDAWADVAELAPKDVTLETPSGERTLSLDFRPIEVGGRITRIMLLATDETEKRRL